MKWHPQGVSQNALWSTEGFPDESLARSWRDRACGPACVQAIISHYSGRRPGLYEVISAGLAQDAYVDGGGWKHAGLASLLGKFGLSAKARKLPAALPNWQKSLGEGRVLIASTSHKLPVDGRVGGHLIVVHELMEKDGTPWLRFMDPSEWGRDNTEVEAARFCASYSGRVIEVAPPKFTAAQLAAHPKAF